MLGILFAFFGGTGSLYNYGFLNNLFLQFIFTIISLLSLFIYHGKKMSPSYTAWGVKYFTIGYAICIISFIGSATVCYAIFNGL